MHMRPLSSINQSYFQSRLRRCHLQWEHILLLRHPEAWTGLILSCYTAKHLSWTQGVKGKYSERPTTMYLTSAAARPGRGAIEAVTRICIRAEARTLATSGDDFPRLEGGLLHAHRAARRVRRRINDRLIRTQNTSALAECKVGCIIYGGRHFLQEAAKIILEAPGSAGYSVKDSSYPVG